MAKSYTFVAEVESRSRPGKTWTVKRDDSLGLLTCSCPSWIFNHRGNRTCKHTDAVLGMDWGVKMKKTASYILPEGFHFNTLPLNTHRRIMIDSPTPIVETIAGAWDDRQPRRIIID